MRILFLTIVRITDIAERGIYTDLMRRLRDAGHSLYIAAPAERRFRQPTALTEQEGVHILQVRTLNIQKTNIIEKGIATLLLEYQFHRAIKHYLGDIPFDLVMYSTPPITFTKVVRAIKKRDRAKAYLLLKDIFPQNAVDLGMLKKNGFMHRFFRGKEKALYAASDYIGCMSPANVAYVLRHNPGIDAAKVEVCPNSIEVVGAGMSHEERAAVRRQYGIPDGATVFIYGGNLGKPQGLDFVRAVLAAHNNKPDRFFIIIGSGIEFPKMAAWFRAQQPANARLFEGLPKNEYDRLVQACDVGLIFLDPRFTIPNYPSRLLSYLEYKKPILAAVDASTDLGAIAEENGYGLACLSGDLAQFSAKLERFVGNRQLIEAMGARGFAFLQAQYTVEKSYQTIMRHFSGHVC